MKARFRFVGPKFPVILTKLGRGREYGKKEISQDEQDKQDRKTGFCLTASHRRCRFFRTKAECQMMPDFEMCGFILSILAILSKLRIFI